MDKLSWKLLWKNIYSEEAQLPTEEQKLIKRYEQNPTPENYDKIRKHIAS